MRLAIVFVSFLPFLALSLNPGFRVHVADAGIDYVKYVAISTLNDKLPGYKFPDIPFKNAPSASRKNPTLRGGEIKDIVLTAFNIPYYNSFITTIPDRGITWEARKIHVRVDMSYKQSIFKGDVKAETGDASLSVTAKLAATPTGQPALQDVVCSFNVGDLDLNFHGSFSSFFINWFHGIIEDKLKPEINKMVCLAVRTLIEKGNEPLSQLSMTFDIGDHLTLDYAFIGSPVYGSTNFIDLNLKGEFYSGAVHSPEPRPEIVDLTQSAPMVYMQFSEYMFNSLAYSMQKQGFLVLRIDQALIDSLHIEKIPPDFMNTTCSKICFGKLIPMIGMSFTDGSIFINFVSTSTPVFHVSTDASTFDMTGLIEFKVTQADGTEAPAFDFSVTVRAQLTDIRLENNRFVATANVTDHTFKFESSAIGDVNVEALENFWNLVIDKVVVKLLNKVATTGFPLPTIPMVEFINPHFTSEEKAFLLRTDMRINEITRF